MQPEQTLSESDARPDSAFKKHFCQVTPLSKYFAFALFIMLPFIGGYVGYVYAPETAIVIEKRAEVEKVNEKQVNNEVVSEIEDSTAIAINPGDQFKLEPNQKYLLSDFGDHKIVVSLDPYEVLFIEEKGEPPYITNRNRNLSIGLEDDDIVNGLVYEGWGVFKGVNTAYSISSSMHRVAESDFGSQIKDRMIDGVVSTSSFSYSAIDPKYDGKSRGYEYRFLSQNDDYAYFIRQLDGTIAYGTIKVYSKKKQKWESVDYPNLLQNYFLSPSERWLSIVGDGSELGGKDDAKIVTIVDLKTKLITKSVPAPVGTAFSRADELPGFSIHAKWEGNRFLIETFREGVKPDFSQNPPVYPEPFDEIAITP